MIVITVAFLPIFYWIRDSNVWHLKPGRIHILTDQTLLQLKLKSAEVVRDLFQWQASIYTVKSCPCFGQLWVAQADVFLQMFSM